MNFSEAVAEVLRITKRPDKGVEAGAAINKAIFYCSLKGDFPRDTVEGSIAISPTSYGATIPIAALLRFRRFLYVKPTAVKYYLSMLEGSKIFTPKNQLQPDVYYTAGTNLTYTLSALAPALEVAYLTYPQAVDAATNPTHWMLDAMPYAIVDLAAARVFQSIGDETSARVYEASGTEFYLTARKDINQGR